jgi:hypothetical protein
MEQQTLRYQRGSLTGPELQVVVNEVLAELREAPDLDAIAAEGGLTAADVAELRVDVEESGSAIDPFTAFILLHLAGGAVSAVGGLGAKQFVEKVLLPRVRKKRAGDAVGEPREDEPPG